MAHDCFGNALRRQCRMHKPPIRMAQALGHDIADKRLDILRRIGEAGSISEAARGAGVSYKAAWQAIDTLSNLAGTPLLERAVGGAGGGGAQLTDAARQLLATATVLNAARTQLLSQLSRQAHGDQAAVPGLAALGLRTSMRNQLPCVVQAIRAHGQAVRVALALPDGAVLHANITRASAELLALVPGLPVQALCKATAVQVCLHGQATPTQNALRGRATRVSRAAAGGEVSLQLDGGLQLVGFCEPNHGLRLHAPCHALVEASAIVIALEQ